MRYGTWILGVTAATLAVPASANLLDDGAFSNADSGAQTSNSAWVLTVNFPDTVDDAAQFQTGFANAQNTGVGGTEAPGTGAGVWFKPFEGQQGGNTNEPKAQADLFQSVIAPGNGDYTLSFVAGRETNFTAAEFSVTLASSGTGGSDTVDLLTAVIPNGNLGGAASTNPGGTPFSLTLNGVTAGDTLSVRAVMVDGMDSLVNPQSAFLDSFELVPEPASFGLLGAAGLALLRRRK